ncbi:MAG: hypothetical protein ABR533_01120, partial [Desulfonatronovibrio sp.]
LDREETEKIFKMIHFMKEEILKEKDKSSNPDIMQYAGMLSDLSPEEDKLFEQAVQWFRNKKNNICLHSAYTDKRIKEKGLRFES